MFTFKGPYASNASYNVGDVVIYADDRKVYHLQKPAVAGTDPHNTLYWEEMEKDMSDAVIMMNQCITMAINGALTGKVANNLTTTASGKVLDARQGKALKDLIDTTNSNVGSLSNSLSGLAPDAKTLVLASSTSESTKLMALTVEDDGTITAAEYTPPVAEE